MSQKIPPLGSWVFHAAILVCRLVAELLSERLRLHGADEVGRRVRRKGACDVWSMVEGTGAYAVSAKAAASILKDAGLPRHLAGRHAGTGKMGVKMLVSSHRYMGVVRQW